ncbi:MAG: DUF937 domain-containing protein [Bacteroidetes bacterium]|nr:DUF937 domain-containing protein [Bacteroidota bacterium]
MLENLINLIKENAGDAIINNPAVPNEQNDAVIAAAGHSVQASMQNMVSQGKLQDLLSLFHNGVGNTSANPSVQNISTDLIQNLTEKFGFNQSTSTGIANNLIPGLLQRLVSKTNDPADNSFSLQGIISHLTGGGGVSSLLGGLTDGKSGEGIMDKVKQLFGNT